jgi:molybdate transport system substrate-binding protein
MKKKLLTIALALLLALSAAACGDLSVRPPQAEPSTPAPESPTAQPVTKQFDLVVFAAASMTEALEEIAGLYAHVEPTVKLVFNFDSSGTLKTQIEEDAECDLFISAAQRQIDQLDITAPDDVNANRLDYIDSTTRVDILENRVALVVPSGNPANINSFDDLKTALAEGRILMAMGNSDVPVGQYTQKIFEYYGLDEQELTAAGVITYGSNVKEVTTQVSEASVDCGIIYCTDAFSAGLAIIDYATAEMCGRVVYPAAVLKESGNAEAARAFLSYLTTSEAMAIFEKAGFSKPEVQP